MDRPSLGLDRRILVVAGKGGVGKSTLAATLGLSCARAGLRTLVIGSDAREGLSRALGVKPFVYQERRVEENLWGCNITGKESLEEFLILKLKVKAIYDRLLKKDLFHYFIAAAPGLEELFVLGKIWFLLQQTLPDGRPQYERILFDSPATGHGVSLFRTPKIIMETMRVGPIHHYTKDVHHLFTDPAQTAFHIVTIPEEMPVNEAIELDRTIRNDVGMYRGATFVNACYPGVIPAGLEGLWRAVREDPAALTRKKLPVELDLALARTLVASGARLDARHTLAEAYVERLRAEISGPHLRIPYFAELPTGRELTEAMTAALACELPVGALGETSAPPTARTAARRGA